MREEGSTKKSSSEPSNGGTRPAQKTQLCSPTGKKSTTFSRQDVKSREEGMINAEGEMLPPCAKGGGSLGVSLGRRNWGGSQRNKCMPSSEMRVPFSWVLHRRGGGQGKSHLRD